MNKDKDRKISIHLNPHYLSEWNKLDPEIRLALSIAAFKTKMLSKIRPLPNLSFEYMIQ